MEDTLDARDRLMYGLRHAADYAANNADLALSRSGQLDKAGKLEQAAAAFKYAAAAALIVRAMEVIDADPRLVQKAREALTDAEAVAREVASMV